MTKTVTYPQPYHLTITELVDDHDCETCGGTYAYGYRVELNNKTILELKPLANCFEVYSYSPDDLIKALLPMLGYSVTLK